MKIFALPSGKTNLSLLFDLDCTLYTNDEYAQTQIDLPVKRLARLRSLSFEQMNGEIKNFRKNWAESHEGKSISLGNTMTHFGITIKENVIWREELCEPEKYLSRDEELRRALKRLRSRFSFAVVTNNPVSVAVRTLKVLGVEDLFENIVGLDTCFLSKPHEAIFKKAAELCGSHINQCVSVGDRYDIDIALPLELGMGGILVDGAEDIYKLPDVLT